MLEPGPAGGHDWNRETRTNAPRNRDANLAAAPGCVNGRDLQIKGTERELSSSFLLTDYFFPKKTTASKPPA